MIEILAPCGSVQCVPAALNTGADAVYLGVRSFSARRNAANFTQEELSQTVRLCHISGVKVYVTVNTLIFDDELAELEKTANMINECGVDAVIAADMGAARVIRRAAPGLKLHASTQMTVTSASGAEFARKNGFSRVVLAREMSLKEIEDVTGNVDIETEVFVHGALCVCVSGQCLMSAMYGGRSGNRGLCAQPCRLPFTVSGRENVLSLKDLSVIDYLPELEAAGVTSAKIEGRMKRPEYVAAAVTACRDVLAGRKPDLEDLKAVFSRSGFTGAYLDGTMNNMSGIRTKDDVLSSAGIPEKLRHLYDKPYKRYRLDISAVILPDMPVRAQVRCAGTEFEYISDIIPQRAENRALTSEEAAARLSKTGGTVFEPGEISVQVGEGLSLSAAAINAVRRGIIAGIEDRLAGAGCHCTQ